MLESRGQGWMWAAVVLAAALLAGCASRSRAPAPVEDRSARGSAARNLAAVGAIAKPLPGAENVGKPGYYTVRPGDTLIRIVTGQRPELARYRALEQYRQSQRHRGGPGAARDSADRRCCRRAPAAGAASVPATGTPAAPGRRLAAGLRRRGRGRRRHAGSAAASAPRGTASVPVATRRRAGHASRVSRTGRCSPGLGRPAGAAIVLAGFDEQQEQGPRHRRQAGRPGARLGRRPRGVCGRRACAATAT